MAQDKLMTEQACVVIGGSAGSLKVLLRIVPRLWAGLPFPVIVVLHRKKDPDSSMEQLFREHSRMRVKEAEDKEPLCPGAIYLAPPDYHLLIEKDYSLALDASEKVLWSRPSIDVTFESAAEVFGSRTLGILLSGANNDGAAGLAEIQNAGGCTIVQDPANAEMPVMPEAALALLQPAYVLPDRALAEAINHFRQPI